MKIAICGSMTFTKEMVELKNKLEALGHNVILPRNTERYADGTWTVENKWEKMEYDLIRGWYEEIKKSDAILVANYTKNKIENYIGGNSLIEMAFAHVLYKKIFLLNPVPKMPYSDEIESFSPVVFGSNLEKIK